jgi:hypothetical protein
MKTLLGFDFITYLQRRCMLGVVDPWRKTFEDKPILTILVTPDMAYEECKKWSNQEFSKQSFIDYLKINDIYLFKNIENFVEKKEEKKKEKSKRILSPETKEKRRNQMIEINKSKKPPSPVNP